MMLVVKVFSIISVSLILCNYLALGFTEVAKLWFNLSSISKVVAIFVISAVGTWYLCRNLTFRVIVDEYFKKEGDIPKNFDHGH